jgi:formyltetrahydrofolate-dependent phosphoribosylglycinamide formyltransferase
VFQSLVGAGLPLAVLVVDRPCEAVERAQRAGVAVEVVDRASYLPDRDAFTHAVVDALKRHDVGLVAMAGFMTILNAPIFTAFPDRVVNTHPSLLPSFRGAHAVREALAAGVKVSGCTIHLAVPEVDAGPILAQEAVPVLDGDTEGTLHDRIKAVERRLYPEVLRGLIEASTTEPHAQGAQDGSRAAIGAGGA